MFVRYIQVDIYIAPVHVCFASSAFYAVVLLERRKWEEVRAT